MLATEATSSTVAVLDPAAVNREVVARIEVGPAPWDVAVSEATGQAVVSTAVGLTVIDLGVQEAIRTIPYTFGPDQVLYGEYRPGGTGVAISPDGRFGYVAVVRTTGAAVVEKIDLRDGSREGWVEVGQRPFDIVLSADGAELYSINHDSFSVHIIQTSSMGAVEVAIAPFGTEGGLASWEKPHYGALAADGSLLLPFQGRTLAILDPATASTRLELMTANSHQHGAALTQGNTSLLVVGTGSFGNATGTPNLTVRDLAAGSEVVIPLQRLHENVLPWSPAVGGSEYALLSGGYTRDGFWDGLTMIDLATLEQHEILGVKRPQALAVFMDGADGR
ncbi:YncE family protein [Arthrobacter sp. MDB2-24]